MTAVLDVLEATTNALNEIKDKFKEAQQTTEEMYMFVDNESEENPEE